MNELFTQDELTSLQLLCKKHDIVKKLYDKLEEFTSDDSMIVKKEISKTAVAIANELIDIREGSSEGLTFFKTDDKIYERVMKFLVDGGKIIDNMQPKEAVAKKPEVKKIKGQQMNGVTI